MVVAAAVAVTAVVLVGDDGEDGPSPEMAAAARIVMAQMTQRASVERTVEVYGGVGTWVDVFDFSPAYQNGGEPSIGPDDLSAMASAGVRTLYLQAARADERSPGLLLEEDLLAEFLVRAHTLDMVVVGWYLPTFEDVDHDLERLVAISEFEALGHRFDGVAVDIEATKGVPELDERNRRLVQLSQRLRNERPGDALGAIVFPPVQIEVVNPFLWPSFPWATLDAFYDVWLPMAYWTFRSAESGYRDPYRYTEESIRRLRANVGRDVPVHPIGGIGDLTTGDDLEAFRRAVAETGSIGASLYDWNTMGPVIRAAMAGVVPD